MAQPRKSRAVQFTMELNTRDDVGCMSGWSRRWLSQLENLVTSATCTRCRCCWRSTGAARSWSRRRGQWSTGRSSSTGSYGRSCSSTCPRSTPPPMRGPPPPPAPSTQHLPLWCAAACLSPSLYATAAHVRALGVEGSPCQHVLLLEFWSSACSNRGGRCALDAALNRWSCKHACGSEAINRPIPTGMFLPHAGNPTPQGYDVLVTSNPSATLYHPEHQLKLVLQQTAPQAPTNGNVVKDLLSLDDDDTPSAAAASAAPAAFADDLLGGLASPTPGQPSAAAAPIDLLSLLDDPAPAAASSSGAPPPQQHQPLVSPDPPRIPREHPFFWADRGMCDALLRDC